MFELLILIVFLGVALAIITAVFNGVTTCVRKSRLKRILSRLGGFLPSQVLLGVDGRTGIAVNETVRHICILDHREGALAIPSDDLLAVELFEDGETLTSTVRSSQAAGAIIGGLAFGGVGAIIGGLSGSSRSSHRVRSMEIKVTVNDARSPSRTIKLLEGETKKTSSKYKSALQKGRHWHGLLEVAIKRADKLDAEVVGRNRPAHSVADELRKLTDLWKEGALNDDQFEKQKSMLLG